MKALVFDPFCGASGDMILGSLLDIGADLKKVRGAIDSLDAGDIKIEVQCVRKSGITATKASVICDETYDRRFKDIVEIVEGSGLSEQIVLDSIAVFSKIADAESKIHDASKEDLKFHEVGSSDAIADVVGSITAFHNLGLFNSSVYCMPVAVGGGSVECVHGTLPIPAPATLEILVDSEIVTFGGPVEMELLTPTGAAILSHLVSISDDFFPQMKIERVGYGAGSYDLPMPNVLRTVIGEVQNTLLKDHVEVLETSVDDVTGEVLGNLIDRLMELGAKDVAIIPATMKKGRSGYVIQVITKSTDTPCIIRKIIEETGSLGVRVMSTRHRLIALREIKSVKIEVKGSKRQVDVKIATDTEGRLLNISAEFEDAKRVAKEFDIPLREIIKRAEEVARREFL
ncbi:MAG: nickel pincer cofactor biosynthesis protein LarC [Halobacteriota archaeon]|nr:nickel pincer cofactor biosynthesis protein LarC [Halobacteriota archaeon]